MIAHIDADSFFASVLQRKHPQLKGKPLLALGMGSSNVGNGRASGGCVIAASYEAKAKGVKTGMSYRDAIKLCPEALSIPSDFRETGLASKQIESILEKHCPVIEQMSIDEWFLDLQTLVGGVPEDLGTWARDIRQKILRMTALSVSVGIAPAKLLAKMASEYRKPGGITIVLLSSPAIRNTEYCIPVADFLRDRPAAAIPGIGRRRVVQTDARGWTTAWDIASADPEEISKLFGKNGRDIQSELLGRSVSSLVSNPPPPKSVSRCRSFPRTANREFLWAHLLRHLEYTVLKMRRHGLSCRGVSVWLRDKEYNHEGAGVSLPQPADTTEAILPFARDCFDGMYRKSGSYTQTGLALQHLGPSGQRQHSLFENPKESDRDDAIQSSLDRLHERFGRSCLTRGSALMVETGTKQELSVYE